MGSNKNANKITMHGNLCRAWGETRNGYLTNTIAFNYRDIDGEYNACLFVNLIADMEYDFDKGDLVEVTGDLSVSEYKTKTGDIKTGFTIFVNDINLFEYQKKGKTRTNRRR